MNLADIVALAKEGYKPSDIKELIALASSQEGTHEEENKDQDKKTEQHEDGKEQPDEAPNKSTDTSSNESAIDEYKKQIDELKEQVKKLQSENVHKDYEEKDKPSDDELLNNITRTFM